MAEEAMEAAGCADAPGDVLEGDPTARPPPCEGAEDVVEVASGDEDGGAWRPGQRGGGRWRWRQRPARAAAAQARVRLWRQATESALQWTRRARGLSPRPRPRPRPRARRALGASCDAAAATLARMDSWTQCGAWAGPSSPPDVVPPCEWAPQPDMGGSATQPAAPRAEAVAAAGRRRRVRATAVARLRRARNARRGRRVAEVGALHEAVREGDLERVMRLLEGGEDIERRDAAGATALHWAVRFLQADAAQLLIDEGADVDAPVAVRPAAGSPLRSCSLGH